MIYLYVNAIILYIILFTLYKKYKEYVPVGIRNNINPIQILLIIFAIYIIGSPIRMESTSSTGKVDFSSTPVLVDRVVADPKPQTSNLEEEFEKLKQQSKEISDEIDE